MAVKKGEFDAVESFEDWYEQYSVDPERGTLRHFGFAECALKKTAKFLDWKREMDHRVGNYHKYERMADAAIVEERPDLPNVSSGEGAGFLRRIARSVVQHTPNITVSSVFDDDKVAGVIASYICKSKVIGDDEYSNNMQQHLYATMVRAAALGFDCVIPALARRGDGSWYTHYDAINYRDVFPEPGAKDVRQATAVFIRRYLTRGEVWSLLKTNAPGWDQAALRSLLETTPVSREFVDHQSLKHSVNTDAYEIITWYSNSGDPFLTWAESTKMLLRIERNKHPLKEHPVMFFVPEYDGHQPFGRSLLSLIYGRQEFQDWFLNGAMKLWRLNIEPPIIGYGVVNAIPNIGPGKYTSIQNPNAKVEAFEVNSNTLMMFNQITAGNAGNMAQIIGATDQQMASQGTGGAMSQTPQGIEAQQQMVDVTTNNYQKAMESFFSRYCSYALTVYFQELKNVKSITPSHDAKKQLLNAGMPPEAFIHEEYTKTEVGQDGVERQVKVKADKTGLKNGEISADFSDMAVLYWVKVVPGSLIELEDEKQSRILNSIFVPLTQAMAALAQTGDQAALSDATSAVRFIIEKQIELSGSQHSEGIRDLFTGKGEARKALEARTNDIEAAIEGTKSDLVESLGGIVKVLEQLQEQNTLLRENQEILFDRMGEQIPSSVRPGAPAPAENPAIA